MGNIKKIPELKRITTDTERLETAVKSHAESNKLVKEALLILKADQKEDLKQAIDKVVELNQKAVETKKEELDKSLKFISEDMLNKTEAIMENNREIISKLDLSSYEEFIKNNAEQIKNLEKNILDFFNTVKSSNEDLVNSVLTSNENLTRTIEKSRKQEYKMKIERQGGFISEIKIKPIGE